MSESPTSLHPSRGARFLLERRSVSADHERAGYRASIYTPERRFDYRAELLLDGGFEVAPAGEPAADDLAGKLETIVKLVARAARKRLADGLPPWPHRVLRWRGPGRG